MYQYTPYIWPILASAVLATVLLVRGIQCRSAPGGVPFVVQVGAILAWILANALVMISATDAARFFWFRIQATVMLPAVTAGLCFAVEYAGLGKFLTRRMLALLAVTPIACAIIMLTDPVHHLMWTRIWIDGYVRVKTGVAGWCGLAYAYILSAVHLLVLAWLFVRSPRHRGIAATLIATVVIVRCASFFRCAGLNAIAPFDPMVMVITLALLPYAVAVFRFRMFDVVSVARNVIIERMADVMIMLDAQNRIVDLNGTAETLLGIVRSTVLGRRIADVVSSYPDLLALTQVPEEVHREVSLGSSRCYQGAIVPLIDDRGFRLGRLVSLHEITELKRAQSLILDHQRTLAMLSERELLARELHDGVGQLLAAAHLQASCAREFLARGDTASVESCLTRVSEATQKAKESVGEYLRGVKTRSGPQQGLIAALRRYIEDYSRDHGIRTELVVSPGLEEQRIDAVVEAQVQPIVQEALVNARRHGRAKHAKVTLVPNNGTLHITIEDDGCGFNPDEIARQGFGLRSMRGRAEAIGGLFEVDSKPGAGTRVTVRVPWRKGAM
ncbi:MAG: histidine kinase N-terminal 7TM domain-containing protein [Solirubrobacterales bacterium]